MTSVLFGSISSVADTSEMQRQAFNDAFAEHGLGWTWERPEYQRMLRSNGGSDRIASYAQDRGETVDAEAVHATKSRLFQSALASASDLGPRDGVAQTITDAKQAGHRVALVTTTSPENVEALLAAVGPHLPEDAFDLVLDRTSTPAGKPDPAAYEKALSELGEKGSDCVAVEDNAGGVAAAVAAGVVCVAFPNANTAGQEFPGASDVVERVDLAHLAGLTTN